jgi:hypothetical protein
MFEYYTPGANEPVSSIIGLLSLVELLSKVREDLTRNSLLFVLFDNEAFDYGGSSRFSNDLLLDKFPSINVYNQSEAFRLDKTDITTMLELGQLGSISLAESNILHIHKDPISYGKSKAIQEIIDGLSTSLETNSKKSIKKVSNDNQIMPPSSIQSFLRQGLNIAGLQIADHELLFTNKFYHSVFDTPENLDITFPTNITEPEAYNHTTLFAKRLQALITSIAQTVYVTSSDKASLPADKQVDQITLNKLVYCFYQNTTCSFFKSILTDNEWQNYLALLQANLPKYKLSFYTGVNDNSISGKWISTKLLKYFSRNLELESLNSTECSSDSEYVKQFLSEKKLTLRSFTFVDNSVCVASSVYPISSVSPAFARSSEGLVSQMDTFSAWSESSWQGVTIQTKIFMYTNDVVKIFSLVLGIVIFLLSIGVTFLANKYSDRLFANKNSEQATDLFEQ